LPRWHPSARPDTIDVARSSLSGHLPGAPRMATIRWFSLSVTPLACLGVSLAGACFSQAARADDDIPPGAKFAFQLRNRVETKPPSGRFHTLTKSETWDPKETAVIVCDMWDLHHCLNATLRGGEMAPRMDEVLKSARERGATIIHAPSSCMEAYKDHPARKHA